MTSDTTTSTDPRPKYLRVTDHLRALATQAGPGVAIPSERALMDELGVSRATVRHAVADLVHEGILTTRAGLGTFVTLPRVETSLHLASFSQDMRRRGHKPSTRVVSMSLAVPPAAQDWLPSENSAWHLERVRLADGEPMAFESQWLNVALVPDLGQYDLRGSVYDLLAREYHRPVDWADQTVWAEAAPASIAAHLGIAAGAPTLVFERRSSSREQPLEFITSWYRADRYRVTMHLEG